MQVLCRGKNIPSVPLTNFLGDIPQELVVHNLLSVGSLQIPSNALSWALKGLLTNAADASPPDSEITLECKEEGEYIYFTVIDHGYGMTEEIVSQAPDPFFTTKPVGKGMGLGLFLAKSLANQLGGSLKIHSAEKKGTTVTMSFKKSLIIQPTADMEG